ncbi:hypothetical protein MMC30_009189 [Trapelia coarctata]|nr:hypothetical protein [Trapelia coarctata]
MATPTLTSPLPTPSSSRRTSTSSPIRSHSPSPVRHPTPTQRRNRAALRDYYGLKSTNVTNTLGPSGLGIVGEDGESVDGSGVGARDGPGGKWGDGEVKEGEMDKKGFDAEKYVREVLGRESLEGVLKIEGTLVGEIKSLDGERKALVYDNYSKLITATDTIRKMRLNMDPLTPTTSTLSPAIAHIAETASSLASSLQQRQKAPAIIANGRPKEKALKEEKRTLRQTVKWVLDAPRRLQEQVNSAEREAAEKEWEDVKRLLERWRGTDGVEEVGGACEKVLAGG